MIRRILDSYEFSGICSGIFALVVIICGFTLLHVVAHTLFAGSPVGEVVDNLVSYGD